MSTPEIDPYSDGIAIALDFRRPVRDDDLEGAHELLGDWLASYEEFDPPLYRNCGIEGDAGERRLVLWADRIADPGGAAAAIERARAMLERAKTRLPVASGRHCGRERRDRDLEARLRTPALQVRPGGDLVAQARAIGVLPTPHGLRPAVHWVAAVALLRPAGRLFDAPLSYVVGSGSGQGAIARARMVAPGTLAGRSVIGREAHVGIALE